MSEISAGCNFTPMLVDEIRERVGRRLADLGLGPKSEEIKRRLKAANLGETFLRDFLTPRQTYKDKPHDITIGKLELLAPVVEASVHWLILGVDQGAMRKPSATVVGLQKRINAAKSPSSPTPAGGVKNKR